MKRIIATMVCLLASLGVHGIASAQDHATKATVPFGFYVANTWVPAGTYTMSSSSLNPSVIQIRSGDSKINLLSVARAEDRRAGSGELVFKKYGDQYFLHQILCSACSMNLAFPNSKREKEAQTREARLSGATEVTLALK